MNRQRPSSNMFKMQRELSFTTMFPTASPDLIFCSVMCPWLKKFVHHGTIAADMTAISVFLFILRAQSSLCLAPAVAVVTDHIFLVVTTLRHADVSVTQHTCANVLFP